MLKQRNAETGKMLQLSRDSDEMREGQSEENRKGTINMWERRKCKKDGREG